MLGVAHVFDVAGGVGPNRQKLGPADGDSQNRFGESVVWRLTAPPPSPVPFKTRTRTAKMRGRHTFSSGRVALGDSRRNSATDGDSADRMELAVSEDTVSDILNEMDAGRPKSAR